MQIRPLLPAPGIQYSIVLPIYNERDNLEPLIHEIVMALTSTGYSFEILCVDDKSLDGSQQRVRELTVTRPYVHLLEHVRHFGQSAALATGISRASGEIIITMDADGQNDPIDMQNLLNALKPDIDAVCGVREKRRDTIIRKVSARVANMFRNLITGEKVKDSGCNFRVIRRHVLTDIPVFNGLHRFLPSLLRFQGYRVIEIPIHHRPRIWGKSKYGIHNRLWRGLADCFAMRWWKMRALPAKRLIDEK